MSRRFLSIISFFALVAITILILSLWQVSEYAITPGLSQSVDPLVSVQGLATDHHADRILLTDVYLSQLTAMGWIFAHFQSHTEIIGADQLLPPGVPTSELDNQGFLEMQQSKEAATVAALTALGWRVPVQRAGALIVQVQYPSRAYAAGINVADRIVGINGTPVRSACDLLTAAHHVPVGATEILRVQSATVSPTGTISMGATHSVRVRTSPTPAGLTDSGLGCPGVNGAPQSIIGIGLGDAYTFTLPGTITIQTPSIGGPSAGLAMTLALIDRLSSGSLTGHQSVAATGTIDANGVVGDVGGVAEKTIAVENAGATVFLVPNAGNEVAVARKASNGSLKILGVSTLAQALRDLRSLGGAPPVPLTKPYPLRATS